LFSIGADKNGVQRVLQGSPVWIQRVEGESIHVLYRDKEGFEHVIPGLKKEDLE